jgi:hypothetical protein
MKYPLLLLFIVLVSIGYAQTDTVKAGGEIEFTEKFHDFGDVVQGDSVQYVFKFKNTGNAPVKIDHVVSTCSCTPVVGDTTRIYQPGEMGEILVKFRSAGKQGIIQRPVTVFYNNMQSNTRVSIRLNVIPGK